MMINNKAGLDSKLSLCVAKKFQNFFRTVETTSKHLVAKFFRFIKFSI